MRRCVAQVTDVRVVPVGVVVYCRAMFGFGTSSGFDLRGNPTTGPWVRRITGRPVWVWKGSLFLMFVVILPALAVAAVGVLLGAVVFLVAMTILGGIARLLEMLGLGGSDAPTTTTPEETGRENVRVIDWKETGDE
jgi:hypothetical protein